MYNMDWRMITQKLSNALLDTNVMCLKHTVHKFMVVLYVSKLVQQIM